MKKYYGGVQEGCTERGSWRMGERINKRLCSQHYMELVPTAFNDRNKRRLREQGFTDRCMVCGWDKEKCDIHCIISKKEGGRYEEGNVISLCPNCHRLLHRKKLTIGVKELQVLSSHRTEQTPPEEVDTGAATPQGVGRMIYIASPNLCKFSTFPAFSLSPLNLPHNTLLSPRISSYSHFQHLTGVIYAYT